MYCACAAAQQFGLGLVTKIVEFLISNGNGPVFEITISLLSQECEEISRY